MKEYTTEQLLEEIARRMNSGKNFSLSSLTGHDWAAIYEVQSRMAAFETEWLEKDIPFYLDDVCYLKIRVFYSLECCGKSLGEVIIHHLEFFGMSSMCDFISCLNSNNSVMIEILEPFLLENIKVGEYDVMAESLVQRLCSQIADSHGVSSSEVERLLFDEYDFMCLGDD